MCTKSTNNDRRTDPTRRVSNDKLGAGGGRSDGGYTLLLERMTVEEWDAFRAGDIDAESLQQRILDGDDEQATLDSGWSE